MPEVMRASNADVEALRFDEDTRCSESDTESVARTALLRNTAAARSGKYSEISAVRSPARRGPRTEYRVLYHLEDTARTHRAARPLLRDITIAFTKREKASTKGYAFQRRPKADVWHRSWLRSPVALRRKGTPDTYSELLAYRKWESPLLRARAPVQDAVDGTERERAEFRWLALNREGYAGRWVALDGDRLLAVGDSGREVYAAIANHRRTPLVTRVEPEDEFYFAGWQNLTTTLTFRRSHDYSAQSETGITIPVTLTAGRKSVRLLAKLDTGAAHCIFERAYGEQLGLNIETGQPKAFRTATGEFQAYGHEVAITCFEWEFPSLVFFPTALEIHRNVLGREGWLQQFRVALIDYDSVLHLSHYNE